MVAKVGGGGGRDGEFGVSNANYCIYLEWINNKFLLYSTGSYIQYPVINCNGKEKIEIKYIQSKTNKQTEKRTTTTKQLNRQSGRISPHPEPYFKYICKISLAT